MNTYFSPSRKGLFNLPVGDDSVLLTEEVAAALMTDLSAGKLLDVDGEGNPITVDAPYVPTPEEEYLAKPLAERLTIQIARLNADYDAAASILSADYPEAETKTWTLQVTEARSYQAWLDAGSVGEAPATPFLTELNEGRVAAGVGEGFEDLVARILHKDSIYSPAMAAFTSYRHGIEKRLHDAVSVNDEAGFNAITWSFVQPQAPQA
jgi:hypothetical protein